jgi:8-oxo-dGTP diphosphatase
MAKAPIVDEIITAQKPAVAVDVALFSVSQGELQVGLIKREEEPYFGKPALPGRFVRYEEKIEDTARKALELKGHIKADHLYLEQLYAFGQDLHRDTRIRTISIVYSALLDKETIAKQEGTTFSWHDVRHLPPLAFDHADIIRFAVKRIGDKLFASE